MKIWNWLDGKKTYFIAAASILYAVLGVATHNLQLQDAIQVVLAALGGAAIRHSIE